MKLRPFIFAILFFTAFELCAATIPLTIGATYSGTIALPGETHRYSFSGTPGQRLFLDAQDADSVNIYLVLYSPGGTILYQNNDDFDSGPLVLIEPGAYTLVVDGNGATTGNYRFRLLDFAAAAPLTFGSVLSAQLNPGLACNVYQFNGTRGQRISLQSLSTSSSQAQWQLVSPANTILVSGQLNQNLGTLTLPMTGPYCVLMSGASQGIAPVSFQVLATDVSDNAVTASGFGVPHSGNVSANQTNSFAYTAPAGLPVYFDSLDLSGQLLTVDLVDPFGNAVFSIRETADSGPYVLPRSGTYTLNVRGPNGASGNFNFRLLDLTSAPTLPLSSVVSNSLAAPYQTDIYQLNGAAGQRLFYDSQVGTFANVQIQLLGPDGQTPLNGNFFYDVGPMTLAFPGMYYVIVQNGLAGASSYTFQMLDLGNQPALPLNADLSGTLPANNSIAYQLSGSKGQQLYFYGKAPAPGGNYWTLYDPRNAQLASANIGGDFGLALPYSGTYILVLAANNGTVAYSNQVSSFGFSTNSLTLGIPVTNNIVHPGDQLIYTFTATAGQRLFYDALTFNYPSMNVALVSDTGLTVFSANVSSDVGPVTLTQSGTYSLVFNGNSHTTGGISFQLLDVGAQPAVPINSDVTGSLGSATSAIYQLTGTNGQPLFFNGKGTAIGGAAWLLYDPRNVAVGSANMAADFSLFLPYSGTYALVFQAGNNPVTYSNQVNTVSLLTNALTLGSATTAALLHPGDQSVYTFSGSAGQRVFYDSLNGAYLSGTVSLVSPSGAQVFSGNLTSDNGPYTLTQPGLYSLVLMGAGDSTGSVAFQLLDVGSQPALPLNADISGNLPSNTCVLYTLSGTLGEQLFFNAKGVSTGGASWTLYDPKNGAIAGQNLSGDFSYILPYGGTYVLALSGGANAVSYTNQVNMFAYTTNTLVLGAANAPTIVHPGDQVYYPFSGTAGQRIYYDSRQTNFNNCQVTLVSPTGVTVFSGNSGSDRGPFTLTQSGTYVLSFYGSGDATGPVSFQLLDLAAAQPVSLGGTITDSLADQTETRLYRLAGTVGQRVNLKALGASGNQAIWTFLGLSDETLGPAPYISQDIGVITLPATGNFVVAASGIGSALSPVNYQLSLTDVSDAPVTAAGFGTVNSGTVNSGQTNSFSYAGSAGLPVYFDSQDASGQNLVVDLVAPDGTAVFSVGETSDAGPYILPRSGPYTLSVRGYNGTVSGNFSFRLLNLASSPNLLFNTVVNNALNNPYQTDVYQFTTGSGQTFIYDAVTNDVNYPSVNVQLLDPRRQGVGPGGNFANDRGPFSVQYAGTCYLFLRNNRAVASTYAFQLVEVASQTALLVNTPVTNTLGVYPVLVYKYAGAAGQQLYFRGQSANPSGYWTLYDPNNAGVAGAGAGLVNDFEVTLPMNGLYSLVLSSSSSSPGAEVFQVNDFSYATNNYTLGNQVVDAISRPGERRVFTFTGTVGQRLIYDALTNDPAYPNVITVQLLNPQGVGEGPIGGRFSVDRGPFTLQQSGVYSLVFDGAGASVGPLAFQMLDVSALSPVPVNVGTTNTLDSYAGIAYRLAGTRGQQFYFRGQQANPSGNWTFYDPNNTYVSGAGLSADFEVTLPMDGTYVLLLNNYSTTGPESFQVNDFSFFTNNYAVGTAVVDSINRPGERRSYSFLGTIGQELIYDALTNDPPAPNTILAQLLNPQGLAEGPIGGRFTFDRGPFKLQQSGLYTLMLDGNGAGVGPVAFQLLDVAVQPALSLNAQVTNTLTPYGLIVYRYEGTAGQQLYFRGQVSNPSGSWTLYDPNTSYVASAALTFDFETTLPMTGTYCLVFNSYSSTPGPVSFHVSPFNFGENFFVNRGPTLNHVPDQLTGEGTPLNFTAQATDPDNDSLTFSVDPGGPPGASIDPSSGVFSWTPPPTGFSFATNVTIRVTDHGTPNLSSAQTFSIAVVATPVMMTVKKVSGTATVFWRSAIGKHYQLQYKNDLGDADWTNVGGTVAAIDFVTSIADASIGNNQQRFYRVVLLDPY